MTLAVDETRSIGSSSKEFGRGAGGLVVGNLDILVHDVSTINNHSAHLR